MGIDPVAALAAWLAGPVAAMTSTWRSTSSAARPGRLSTFSAAHRYSMMTFSPFTQPTSRSPSSKAFEFGPGPADVPINPIRGTFRDCSEGGRIPQPDIRPRPARAALPCRKRRRLRGRASATRRSMDPSSSHPPRRTRRAALALGNREPSAHRQVHQLGESEHVRPSGNCDAPHSPSRSSEHANPSIHG